MIDQEVRILIMADHRSVFEYISDLRNDRYWRTEVNSTSMEGAPGIGTVAVESSFLSRRVPEYVAKLVCTDYIPLAKVIYETLPGNVHYLKSSRSVAKLENNVVEITYRLEFSSSLAVHGLGFPIPAFIISIVTKQAMKKYMKLLKNKIESKTEVSAPQ